MIAGIELMPQGWQVFHYRHPIKQTIREGLGEGEAMEIAAKMNEAREVKKKRSHPLPQIAPIPETRKISRTPQLQGKPIRRDLVCFWCDRPLSTRTPPKGFPQCEDSRTKDHLIPAPLANVIKCPRDQAVESCYECNQKRCKITSAFASIQRFKLDLKKGRIDPKHLKRFRKSRKRMEPILCEMTRLILDRVQGELADVLLIEIREVVEFQKEVIA